MWCGREVVEREAADIGVTSIKSLPSIIRPIDSLLAECQTTPFHG